MATICELQGTHENAVSESIGGGIYKLTCPRCGEFAIMTMKDFIEAIIKALDKQGKYTNIERIS